MYLCACDLRAQNTNLMAIASLSPHTVTSSLVIEQRMRIVASCEWLRHSQARPSSVFVGFHHVAGKSKPLELSTSEERGDIMYTATSSSIAWTCRSCCYCCKLNMREGGYMWKSARGHEAPVIRVRVKFGSMIEYTCAAHWKAV